MEQEAHETSRDDWVAYPDVPRNPLGFNPVEVGQVRVGVEHTGVLIRERGGVGHGLSDAPDDGLLLMVMVVVAEESGAAEKLVRGALFELTTYRKWYSEII